MTGNTQNNITKEMSWGKLSRMIRQFEYVYKIPTDRFIELYNKSGPPEGVDHLDALEWGILADSWGSRHNVVINVVR